MTGKTALITRANSGLGFEASRQLAAKGDEWGRVILACRSQERGEAAKARLIALTGRPDATFRVLEVNRAKTARCSKRWMTKRCSRSPWISCPV